MPLSHDAMKQMYEEYSDEIYRFICWQTGDSILAEDLTSEVFFKSWKSRASYREDNKRAWLYKIARNLITDHWRKKKTVALDEQEEVVFDFDLEEEVAKREQLQTVQQVVTTLRDDHRTVLSLRLFEQLPYSEVAASMGKAEGAIRVLYCRALKELRSKLER